jgi:hypothetical protein
VRWPTLDHVMARPPSGGTTPELRNDRPSRRTVTSCGKRHVNRRAKPDPRRSLVPLAPRPIRTAYNKRGDGRGEGYMLERSAAGCPYFSTRHAGVPLTPALSPRGEPSNKLWRGAREGSWRMRVRFDALLQPNVPLLAIQKLRSQRLVTAWTRATSGLLGEGWTSGRSWPGR